MHKCKLNSSTTYHILPTTYQKAFTIVELLVVIVVIAILAAITIVSYTGITSKATAASLVSDLDNASKQLNVFQVLNNAYPTVNVCPAVLSTDICLKASSGTTFTYAYNNSNSIQTFNLLATKGSTNYRITNDSSPTLFTPAVATGGTVTTDGRYRVHTFTTSGTLTVTTPGTAEVLVVGGGGGGSGGGGGAGGYSTGIETLIGAINITVGSGGAGQIGSNVISGTDGQDSAFGVTRIAKGGGGGGGNNMNGSIGGSGGGASWSGGSTTGGAASPAGQGNNGGSNSGFIVQPYPSGGGGGVGSVGQNAVNGTSAGNGGAGLYNDIVLRGTNIGYSGGGGGGVYNSLNQAFTAGIATHNGGSGGSTYSSSGVAGVTNTGGGGGGACISRIGGAGGSGIVIIRYLIP